MWESVGRESVWERERASECGRERVRERVSEGVLRRE